MYSFPGKSFALVRLLLRRKIIHFSILRYQFDIFIEQVLIITFFDPDICISEYDLFSVYADNYLYYSLYAPSTTSSISPGSLFLHSRSISSGIP